MNEANNSSLSGTLTIQNLETTLQNNEEIKVCVERITECAANIKANTDSINVTIDVANDNIKNNLENFNNNYSNLGFQDFDLEEYGNFSIQIPDNLSEKVEVPKPEGVNKCLPSFISDVQECAINVLASIEVFDKEIMPLIEGKILESDVIRLTENDINQTILEYFGVDSSTMIAAASGIVKSALENSEDWRAFGFLLGYTGDIIDGGDNSVGETVSMGTGLAQNALVKYLSERRVTTAIEGNITAVEPISWLNTAAGTIGVVGFSLLKDKITDKGDFDSKDLVRAGFNAASAASVFVESVVIGSTIGGPVGALISGVVAVPTQFVVGIIRDSVVGDNVIDEIKYSYDIDKDGNIIYKLYNGNQSGNDDNVFVYEVYANGNGKDGTTDVLRQNYRDEYNESVYLYPYGQISLADAKSLIYSDVCKIYNDYSQNSPYLMNSLIANVEEQNKFKESLADLLTQEFKSSEEARQWYENKYGVNGFIYADLKANFDFDIFEYYQYQKIGTWRA